MLLSACQHERLETLPENHRVVNVWNQNALVVAHPPGRYLLVRPDGRVQNAGSGVLEELAFKRIDEVAPLV